MDELEGYQGMAEKRRSTLVSRLAFTRSSDWPTGVATTLDEAVLSSGERGRFRDEENS
jgi:hypothetical protein